jgi:DNA-binding LacI/PurR family transcriptional regulator/DNA-binding transcriptional regulator YhcF (GntR family)
MTPSAFEIELDRSTSLPIYQQIYQVLRRRILSGELAPGMALPSERQLSAELRIDRLTLRQAVDRLEKDRLIRRQRGVGTFVEEPSKRKPATQKLQVGILVWGGDRLWQTGCCAYMKDVYEKFCSSLLQLGMGVYSQTAGNGLEEFQSAVQSRLIQGVISLPYGSKKDLAFLEGIDLPKILLEYRDRRPGMDNVLVDSHPGVYAGVTELLKLGHRNIVYVGALLIDKDRSTETQKRFRMAGDSLDRLRAFRQALDDEGIPFNSAMFEEIDYSQASADALIARCMARNPAPTAYVVFEDELSMNVLRSLRARGLEAPRDVSLLGFGNSVPESRDGQLATVVVNYEQMVDQSVRRIFERMTLGGISGQTLLVDSRFKSGASMGPPKK